MDPVQANAETTSKETTASVKPASYFSVKLGISVIIAIFFALLLAAAFHKLDVLSNAVNNLQSNMRSQLSDINTTLATQQSQLNALQQDKTGERWALLLQTNHLVQLANYNLFFMHDVNTALSLLQMADAQLQPIDKNATDSQIVPLRQTLAYDIAALKAIPKLDKVGLLTQLTALQKQVTQLPVLAPPDFAAIHKDINKLEKNSPNLNIWQRALRNSWATLQKIIVVRRNDQPIVPLLPQEQQAYLQQNLQLLLQQAQWAVLRNQNEIYQASLTRARTWANQYFATNASATQAFVQTIEDLQKTNLTPRLPDLSATINLFNQTINNQAQRSQPTDQTGKPTPQRS